MNKPHWQFAVPEMSNRRPAPFPGKYPNRIHVLIEAWDDGKPLVPIRWIGKPSVNVYQMVLKARKHQHGAIWWREADTLGPYAMTRFHWGKGIVEGAFNVNFDSVLAWNEGIFSFYHPFSNTTHGIFSRWLHEKPVGFQLGKQRWVAYVRDNFTPTDELLYAYKKRIPNAWMAPKVTFKSKKMLLEKEWHVNTNFPVKYDLAKYKLTRTCPYCGANKVKPYPFTFGKFYCAVCERSWNG